MNILRIINVPITHDEALTIVDHTPLPERDIMAMTSPIANNHILNTLLTKLFINLFGYNIFIVRLPNLLGYMVYLLFSARTCQQLFEKRTIQLSVFLLLNLNPFLFEFWGLCRGYGLSIAFMMASILHLLSYIRERRAVQLYLSLFFAIASVYSNFSLLNFYLGLTAAITIIHIRQHGKALSATIAVILSTILLATLIYTPLTKLLESDQLYYGGVDNFVNDTIDSLVRAGLFDKDGGRSKLITFLVATVIVCMLAHTIWSFIKKKDLTLQLILNILLLTPIISTIAQHYLLGTLYLIDRTALFFIPLFVLASTYYTHKRNNKTFTIIIVTLTVLALLNFSANLSFRKTWSWSYNAYERIVMERMVHENPGKKISVRCNWHFAPSFQFYTLSEFKDQFEPVRLDRGDVDGNESYQYYYVKSGELSSLSPVYIVDTSFEGKYYLMKKAKYAK